MLADALLLIIINICAFMLSLNFIDGDFAKQLPIRANLERIPAHAISVCAGFFFWNVSKKQKYQTRTPHPSASLSLTII